MSGEESFDAVVVGAGPGGSTASHLLARAGFRVLVLERETFPRFRIGESLLPFAMPIFERLGVAEEIKGTFQHKFGAYFTEEGNEGTRKVVFADGLAKGFPLAFQVQRAEFDRILIEAARRAGAQVRFGWKVTDFLRNGGAIAGVVAQDPEGISRAIRARVVVDATGRSALGARQDKGVEPVRELRRAAMFAHFRGVPPAEGETPGDIRMVVFAKGWWWLIPFRDGSWSVGVVTSDPPRGGSLEERMDAMIASVPTVRERLAGASRISPVYAESDFSYSVRRIVGDGYAAVGDAAGFLDPIFSSGVFLAMATAERAADDLVRRLRRPGTVRASDLSGYERFARRGFRRFHRFVVAFYNPGFREIFYERPPVRALYSSVTTILAGGVFSRSVRVRFWTTLFHYFARRKMRRELPMETMA